MRCDACGADLLPADVARSGVRPPRDEDARTGAALDPAFIEQFRSRVPQVPRPRRWPYLLAAAVVWYVVYWLGRH